MKLIKVQSQRLGLRVRQTWERHYVDHQSSVKGSDLAKTSAPGHLITNSRSLHDYQTDGYYSSCKYLSQEELAGTSQQSMPKFREKSCLAWAVLSSPSHHQQSPGIPGKAPDSLVQASLQSISTQQLKSCPVLTSHSVQTLHHGLWGPTSSLTTLPTFFHSSLEWLVTGSSKNKLVPSSGSLPLLFLPQSRTFFRQLSHSSFCHCLQLSAQMPPQRGYSCPFSWVRTPLHATPPSSFTLCPHAYLRFSL